MERSISFGAGLISNRRNLVLYVSSTCAAILGSLLIVAIFAALYPNDEFGNWLKIQFVSSCVGTICLMVGILFLWLRSKAILLISACGSVLVFAITGLLMERLYYVAQGNNDAGELFWFVALPMICSGAHIYFSHQSFLQLSSGSE